MLRSNMPHQMSKLAMLALVSLSFAVGCEKSMVTNKTEAKKTSTFFVDKIDPGSSTILQTEQTYGVPTAKNYNFKVCVKDILQSKEIPDQSFTVHGGEKDQRIVTDEAGCLNWSEKVNFNYLAPSQFLLLKREITATGLHKGGERIEMIINPWSHGESFDHVYDPKEQTLSPLIDVDHTLKALSADGATSPLWMNEPRVSIMERDFTETGANFVLKVQSKVSMLLKNSTLQNVQFALNTGKFDVEVNLFNSFVEDGVEKLLPIYSGKKQDVSFTQDLLITEFPFTLNLLPNKGQILMALRLSAPQNNLGLQPFAGVLLLSEKSDIKLESRPTIATNLEYNAITEKLSQIKPTKRIGSLDLAKPGLEVDPLQIKFFKIGSEDTTSRQVFFNIKACIKSNIDKKPIRDVEFTITPISGKSFKLVSNQEGCIPWDDSLWHKFYSKERFIPGTVTIVNDAYKLNEKISVSINPWDTGTNFARDNRYVEDRSSLDINPGGEGPTIVFENYNFSIQNYYDYKIDKYMDLTLIKKGILSLYPRVTNHTSLTNGRMDNERLRDGKYLLRWAVVRLNQDEKLDTVVNAGQQVVTSWSGEIKSNIEFSLNAFKTLNERLRLVISLHTIKESMLKANNSNLNALIDRNGGLKPRPFIATIVLNNDNENQKMYPVDGALGLNTKSDLLEQLLNRRIESQTINAKAMARTDVTAQFLSKNNLKLINLADEKSTLALRDSLANPLKYIRTRLDTRANVEYRDQKPAISSATLAQVARTGIISRELGQQLCMFWFNDYFRRMKPEFQDGVLNPMTHFHLTSACQSSLTKNISSFFTVDKKLMVKEVGATEYESGTTLNMSVGSAFNLTKGQNASVNKTWAWTATTGLNFRFFDVFNIGTSGSYSVSKGISHNDIVNNAVNINANTNLMVQTSTLKVQMKAYEECAVLKLNANLFMGEDAPFRNVFMTRATPEEITRAATGGFYICTGTINRNPIWKEENYFLITQDHWSSGQQQDNNDLRNRMIYATVRGNADMAGFLGMIQGSLAMPNSHTAYQENLFGTKASLVRDFHNRLPTWPGVYTDK